MSGGNTAYHKHTDVTVWLQEDVWISFRGTMDKRLPSRRFAAGSRFIRR